MDGVSLGVPHIEAALRKASKDGNPTILADSLRELAEQAGLTNSSAGEESFCSVDAEAHSASRRSFFVQRRFLPLVHKLVHSVGFPSFSDAETSLRIFAVPGPDKYGVGWW